MPRPSVISEVFLSWSRGYTLLAAVSTCFEQGRLGEDKSILMSTSHKLDANNVLTTHYVNNLKGGVCNVNFASACLVACGDVSPRPHWERNFQNVSSATCLFNLILSFANRWRIHVQYISFHSPYLQTFNMVCTTSESHYWYFELMVKTLNFLSRVLLGFCWYHIL